jgi:hypothetical protein
VAHPAAADDLGTIPDISSPSVAVPPLQERPVPSSCISMIPKKRLLGTAVLCVQCRMTCWMMPAHAGSPFFSTRSLVMMVQCRCGAF